MNDPIRILEAILVGGIIAAAVYHLYRRFFPGKKKSGNCGASGCPSCGPAEESSRTAAAPLIPSPGER